MGGLGPVTVPHYTLHTLTDTIDHCQAVSEPAHRSGNELWHCYSQGAASLLDTKFLFGSLKRRVKSRGNVIRNQQ